MITIDCMGRAAYKNKTKSDYVIFEQPLKLKVVCVLNLVHENCLKKEAYKGVCLINTFQKKIKKLEFLEFKAL